MPKKTKREKIIAELRRRSSSSPHPLEHPDTAEVVRPTFAFQAPVKNTASLQSNTGELAVIRHDLLRTFIFALIAVGIELSIYWKISGK